MAESSHEPRRFAIEAGGHEARCITFDPAQRQSRRPHGQQLRAQAVPIGPIGARIADAVRAIAMPVEEVMTDIHVGRYKPAKVKGR